MYMINFLSYCSVVINCAIVYFTSNTYRRLLVYDETDNQIVCVDYPSFNYCASFGSYYKLFTGTGGFLVFILIVEHFIFLIKVFLQKFLSDSETKYDHFSRMNNILRDAHEAKQSLILKERIKKGDSDAGRDDDKFYDINKEGLQ